MAVASDQVELRSVSRPKQARSERTLLRILDAAEALVEERGVSELSIPEVVRRAGSSVGGFYSRFKGKDELLKALEERHLRQVRVIMERLTDPERFEDADIREVVHAGVKALVHVFRTKRRLVGAFISRASSDPDAWREGSQFRRQVIERFGALLLIRGDEISHPDPQLAVDFAIQATLSSARQEAVFGRVRAGGKVLSEEQMVRELERLFLAYLGVTERA